MAASNSEERPSILTLGELVWVIAVASEEELVAMIEVLKQATELANAREGELRNAREMVAKGELAVMAERTWAVLHKPAAAADLSETSAVWHWLNTLTLAQLALVRSHWQGAGLTHRDTVQPAERVVLTFAGNDKDTAQDHAERLLSSPHWGRIHERSAYTAIALNDELTPGIRIRAVGVADLTNDDWGVLASDKDVAIRQRIAQQQAVTPAALDHLSQSAEEWVRREVASHPHTRPDTLERLGEDDDIGVLMRVTENPNTPSPTLHRIFVANPQTEMLVGNIARHPNCPPELLDVLVATYWRLAAAVAANPNCPPALVERLSRQLSFPIREAVARRPDCAPAILERLANDYERDVRVQVAANPNTPPHVLELLLHDKGNSTLVKQAARAELVRRRQSATTEQVRC